jgi:hypothetical protein
MAANYLKLHDACKTLHIACRFEGIAVKDLDQLQQGTITLLVCGQSLGRCGVLRVLVVDEQCGDVKHKLRPRHDSLQLSVVLLGQKNNLTGFHKLLGRDSVQLSWDTK